MKKILVLLLLFISVSLFAQPYVYYVATTGSDSYDGLSATYVSGTNGPWATWQKAFNTANAGDTVYFRGGIYMPTTRTYGWNITTINPGAGYGHNGTHDNPIVYMAYPGEVPILDGSLILPATGNTGIGISGGEYIKFKGLTVRNVRQTADATITGIFLDECNGKMWFENMTFHNIAGEGFWARGYDTLYLTNCDSYSNCDTLAINPGNAGDGFLISSRATGSADSVKTAYITGCRAWYNSDDGFDCNTQEFYVNNNWSWANGTISYNPEWVQRGTGFKLSDNLPMLTSKRVFSNNITAYNTTGSTADYAFTNYEYSPGVGSQNSFYNNFSYEGDRFSSTSHPSYYVDSIWDFQVANNIVYAYNVSYIASFEASFDECGDYWNCPYVTANTNTFILDTDFTSGRCETNPAYTVTADDFLALPTSYTNCTEILGVSRQSDGSLPNIGSYFRLADDSDLKGAGTDVGMSAVPDIGIDWDYLNLGVDSTATGITSFSLSEQTGTATIDTVAGTPSIDIEVEYGTDVSALSPTIVLDYGATISPLSGVETDFTAPVTYTVTALNGVTEKEYTVTVTVALSPDPPTVTLSAPTARHTRLGYANANVTDDGGGTVSARGVCWSTSESPTTSDSKTTRGTGTGVYSNQLTGLNANTTYYVRAYATNENGTAYSPQRSFTTPEYTIPTSGGKFILHNGQISIIR